MLKRLHIAGFPAIIVSLGSGAEAVVLYSAVVPTVNFRKTENARTSFVATKRELTAAMNVMNWKIARMVSISLPTMGQMPAKLRQCLLKNMGKKGLFRLTTNCMKFMISKKHRKFSGQAWKKD